MACGACYAAPNIRDNDSLRMNDRRESNSMPDTQPRIVSHRLQRTAAQMPSAIGDSSSRDPLVEPVLRQVVLVDRDVDALRDIAIALRDEYSFYITISGNEALALLQDGAIDTIVVGQTLYSSTGINVLAAARRNAPQTRRVLLANAAEASGLDPHASGAAPFQVMPRPCTPEKLRNLLEDSFENTSADTHAAANPQPNDRESPAVLAQRFNLPSGNGIDSHRDIEHVVLETAPTAPRRGTGAAAVANGDKVPLVVYTDDAEFHRVVRASVQDRYEVRLATQIERVVEYAEMGRCSILVTDRAVTQVELQRISIAVRAVEPALVTIAAGSLQNSQALRQLIGTNALHSFLPKPLSIPLVRLAVESARRQHQQLKEISNEPQIGTTTSGASIQTIAARSRAAAPRQTAAFYMPTDLSVDGFASASQRRPLIVAGIALLTALLAIGSWYGYRHFRDNSTANRIAHSLELARQAYDAGRFAEPADASALYYYGEVLTSDPDNSQAQEGYELSIERLIERVEQALIEERLSDAAKTLDLLYKLQPNNKRLAYLDAQLNKSRKYQATVRSLSTQNSQTDENRRAENSQTATASKKRDDAVQTTTSIEAQRQQALSRWLTAARQRIARGRLVTPENDSAESFLRQMERVDPNNAIARQLLRDIGERLVLDARQAVEQKQLDIARRRLNEAARFDGTAAAITELQGQIDDTAASDLRNRYLRLALQRTRDNQLLEPERDCARYYVGQLQQLDAGSAETGQALRALGAKLVDNANQAAAQQQFNTAVRLLNEARSLGFQSSELTEAESHLRAARNPAPASVRPLATAPRAIKTVAPKFPEDAMKAGVEGWVDVGFRITADGSVVDVAAVASDPPGPFAQQFERAAVTAIGQYKFESRGISDAAAQRMTVRVLFKMK